MVADLYRPKGVDELKARALRDMRLAAVAAGVAEPATQPGSDYDLIATLVSNTAILGFANQAELERARDVFQAEDDELDTMLLADGLPELPASGSTGKAKITVFGPTSIPAGLTFLLPNRLRGRVISTYLNPEDQLEIDIETIDTGSATELAGGATITFTNPPVNVAANAKVSYKEPLTGGTDDETSAQKRLRILDNRRNKPGGGNWAQLRKIAREALGRSVQEAYIFPALGGPSSVKVVVAKALDPENSDFSRQPSQAVLNAVTSAIHAQNSGGDEIIIQGVVDEIVDFGIQIEIPDAVESGGNGEGWTDAAPWPELEAGDSGYVTITATNSSHDQITVDAETATTPVAGQTHVSWWSGVDRRFYHALVIGVTGGPGAWVLTLDVPFVDSIGNGPVLGDYISPSAQNLDKYGETWVVTIFNALGSGENTTDADRLPRALRHPLVADDLPSSITRATLKKLTRAHPEIADIDFSYAPVKTPSVPGSVDVAPNVLLPRRLGFYPL